MAKPAPAPRLEPAPPAAPPARLEHAPPAAPPPRLKPTPPPRLKPTPRASALRLAPARPRRARRRGLTAGVALALALAVGSLGFLLTRHPGAARATAPRAGAGPVTEAAARDRAAAWVASQVSRAAPISCDQAMCRALEAHGIPAADLLVLGPAAGLPRSGVIVETAAVRGMFKDRLIDAAGPAVIASFGSGNTLISIRQVIPQGAAAYSSALRSDKAARKASETSLLLENQRIKASAAARRLLAAGRVDARLVLAIANLASQRPISIVAFGDLAPGADWGIPFRSADLAEKGGSDPAALVQSMSAFLHSQGGFYRDAQIRLLRAAGSRDVLRIEFTAPSPLGLLGPPTP